MYRPAALGRYRGAVKDGKAVLLDGKVAGPSVLCKRIAATDGHCRLRALTKCIVEGAFDQPYNIPNYRIAGHVTDMQIPLGFWRSVGNSVNAFMHDSFYR